MGLKGRITVFEEKPNQPQNPLWTTENSQNKMSKCAQELFCHSNILVMKINAHDVRHTMEMTFK